MADKKQTAKKQEATVKAEVKNESTVADVLAKPKDASLSKIHEAGYKGLAWYGLLGGVILLAWSLIATIFTEAFHMGGWELLFNIPGVIMGALFAILGIFQVVKVVKSQEGKFWLVFLFGAICAVLSPLAWFPIGGLVLAILASGTFLTYILLEK